MKKTIAGLLIGILFIIFLVSLGMYVWACPEILEHFVPQGIAETTPVPKPLSPHLAIPLLLILAGIVMAKTRRTSVKLVVWGLACVIVCQPAYRIIRCMRTESAYEAIQNMRLASFSILYCFFLFVIFIIATIVRNKRIKQEELANKSSESDKKNHSQQIDGSDS